MTLGANMALATSGSSSPIPSGYTELRYVQIPYLTGKYLNIVKTGVSWANIKKIHVIYSCSEETNHFYMFCSYSGNTQTTPWIKFNQIPITSTNVSSSSNLTLSDWVLTSGDDYLRNGLRHEYTVTTSSSSSNPLGFGAAWNMPQQSRKAEWYLVELFGTDDVLLAQFIPAIRDSDNEVGFWDTVSESFFSRPVSTWGTWIAGPLATENIYNIKDCNYHTISPTSGQHVVAAGTSVAFALTDAVDIGSGAMRYFDFLGHRAAFASADVINSGATTATYNTTSFNHTPDDADVLTWNFSSEESCLVINAPTGGSVTVTPSGGTSDVITGSAVRWYTSGTSVTLVPTAASGYAFANWGDTTDTTATKVVTVSGQTVVTAVFYPVPTT